MTITNVFSSERTVRVKVPADLTSLTCVTLLQTLRLHEDIRDEIVGAQACFGGKNFDVCLKSESAALKLASRGLDFEERHLDFVPVNKTRRLHVSTFVPLEFPDHELNSLLSRYGDIDSIVHKYFTEPGLETYENGCRVVIFTKLDKDLPVRLTYHGVSIGFKYTGQPLSCIRCSSMEHVVKDCPIQRRNRRPNMTVNRPESKDRDSTAPEPTTTAMETDSPTTKPAETPKENGNNATEKPTEKTAEAKENSATPKPTETNAATDKNSNPRKRTSTTPLSPLKSTEKKATRGVQVTHLDQLTTDLQEPDESSILQMVPSDVVRQARAMCFQLKHGDFTRDKSKLLQNFDEKDQKTLTREWKKLKDTIKQDAYGHLLVLYNSKFHQHYEARKAKNTA